jgi:cytochrome b
MSAGPLRRVIGGLGLLTLVPIAVQLGFGAITPEAAATRAAAVAVVVVVLGNVARAVLTGWLGRFERRRGDTDHQAAGAPTNARG